MSKDDQIKRRAEWLAKNLLNWDKEDLEEDIESVRKLSEGNTEVSVSQRLRFHFRHHLDDHIERYKELKEIGDRKGYKTVPWQYYVNPIEIPQEIGSEDIKKQKITAASDLISELWQSTISDYIYMEILSRVLRPPRHVSS